MNYSFAVLISVEIDKVAVQAMAAASAVHMEQLEVDDDDDDGEMVVGLGSYGGKVRLLGGGGGCDEEGEAAAAETMLLWGIQQPTLARPNAFVSQSSLALTVEACGHSLSILQSPSSLVRPSFSLGFSGSESFFFDRSIQ